MSVYVNVMPNGRMSLPVELRRRHGLATGGQLIVQETEDGIGAADRSSKPWRASRR